MSKETPETVSEALARATGSMQVLTAAVNTPVPPTALFADLAGKATDILHSSKTHKNNLATLEGRARGQAAVQAIGMLVAQSPVLFMQLLDAAIAVGHKIVKRSNPFALSPFYTLGRFLTEPATYRAPRGTDVPEHYAPDQHGVFKASGLDMLAHGDTKLALAVASQMPEKFVTPALKAGESTPEALTMWSVLNDAEDRWTGVYYRTKADYKAATPAPGLLQRLFHHS